MNDKVKAQFDAAAREYDRERRQLIPCFDDFYGTAVSLVQSDKDNLSILDVGAGTGLLTSFLLPLYPNASYTLIDFSEKMLDQARERFAGTGANIRYATGDYLAYPFEEKFDWIVSSLSIHHLADEEKRRLFAKLHALTNEGGGFVNADQAAGESPFFERLYDRRWEESVAQSGLATSAIEASKERRLQDRNARAREQVQWLKQAGYSEADCVFRFYHFAVFCALKRKGPTTVSFDKKRL
ncbi:class I SAM-dependent methyltransferase [Cohnella fermenti]|uniref:Class I SAM-dependent methyltransferase n=1 Tax=Cohnella fermenti TaxID=2565925 RepID=A0A4S4BHZ8_9BACL|nr:class I SAM-dependent methyltransferase [Cohnella fermenti]THF74214.1 class I SAM-dependent methyltransferase [Cohnella fermenti]